MLYFHHCFLLIFCVDKNTSLPKPSVLDHHRQERPRLSPSAGFNDLAMEERGRMGAHPASNSMFHQAETVRSRQPAPGISRMPPIPMKLNMNMGGQSAPPAAAKPGGSLALITPVYAVGIMVFFVFTLWKVRYHAAAVSSYFHIFSDIL